MIIKMIIRDKQIKTEAQLSLIGGTMGLLTGFSIISGVEIIFFLARLIPDYLLQSKRLCFIRLVSSFRINRKDIVSATKKTFENHLM